MSALAPAFAVSFALPVLLAVWLAGPWVRSRLEGAVLTLLAGSQAGLVLLAGPVWAWVGMATRWIPVLLVLAALAAMLARWPHRPWLPRKWRALALVPVTVVAAGMAILFGFALAGRVPPGPAIDIALPLEPGRYLVAHGGSTPTLNHHFAVPAQRYALDIVALGPDGRRATGLWPQRVEDYAIHGRAILAPCAGTVLLAWDGAPETSIGGSDPAAPAGNHVALGCTIGGEAVTLLMAHMAPGSVAVEVGTAVAAGTLLGRVGSSGNSSEPHLHLHAVRGTVSELTALVVSAPPVPMRIEGRFLVRNQTFGLAP